MKNWKHPSKGTTLVTVGGKLYRVPKNMVRRFLADMGVNKPPRKTLTRNQWSNNAYGD